MSGSTFLADVAIEYIRITYYPDGPDWVRTFVQDKRNAVIAARKEAQNPANDQAVEIEVSEGDLKRMNKFMEPIK